LYPEHDRDFFFSSSLLEDNQTMQERFRLKLANIQWSEKLLIAQLNCLIIKMQLAEDVVPGFTISFCMLPVLSVLRYDILPIQSLDTSLFSERLNNSL
jgi:hypothetical protein